jgi:hypothetical protein
MNTQGAGMQQHDEEEEEQVKGGDAEVIDLVKEKEKLEDHEVEDVEEDVEAFCMSIEGTVDEEAREKARKILMKKFEKAANAEGRVQLLSKIADWGCLDAVIGLIFPEIGDIGASITEVVYLLTEAQLADMGIKGKAKIMLYQLADLGIGLVPVVGDAGDFVFMANRMSAGEFRKNLEEKALEAREAGVPEEEIVKVLAKNEALMKKLGMADKIVKKAA